MLSENKLICKYGGTESKKVFSKSRKYETPRDPQGLLPKARKY